ncbi:hypothetical protein B0H15DRAFT_924531 [Mycena belliarum]|uniref:CxC2-like cysteine cluster KDZ transposase-associated domain-containing protein n=1 Tax=Mycena belliarum TaxID=1033014 RepID=A0AAD6TZQ1_9AGAR|nr:hypothetical protein B0H15DRAFT_924531 [Mycena belliae]
MAHKRKVRAPALVEAGTASSVSSRTVDDRRQRNRVGVVGVGAGASAAPNHHWQEDLATSAARLADTFTYQLGDESLESQVDEEPLDGITVVVAPRYSNSGRICPNRRCRDKPEYRCVDEACFGEVMHCARCIVHAHAQLPTHFIEVGFAAEQMRWVRRRRGLQELGLRIQLGHPPGVVCPFKQAAPKDFVLYDLSGVHEINVDFCGCHPLEPHRIQLLRACWWPATVRAPNTCATFALCRFFQIVNCLGKLTAYDFLRGLEMTTNHDGLDKPPDRRKPFMHIMREFREVKRQKRAKRGNLAGGSRATQRGELTQKCRQCPQPGWNLPEDWESIDPLFRFLYFLFLAQDANFRLSNRQVSSESADPIMGDGHGYFCKREGADGYKTHIAKHVNEQEISNCSGFQAMFQANTKRIKGLRTTGIGGVTCSRHNMWRPNGIGDLQMGERYCNMDFLLLSALLTFTMAWIIISYDIACQYAIHFWTRMEEFPESMRLKVAPENVWWKVPNFHLPPHKRPCHSPFSFHYMWGAGMTHGEGVEQNWSFSNGAAASTRLMGPGSRQATLEDIFGFHNYDRSLAMYRILPKRLAENIKEGLKHRAAFEAFSAGLEESRPAEVAEWRAQVKVWEAKQHTTEAPSKVDSPFELLEEVSTLRDIQLKIASEEFLCTDDGVEVERKHSPGTFITMGLELEETQRRLEVDVRALKDPSTTQKLAFVKRRTALLKRIFKFRQVQRVYMPTLRALLSDAQRQVYDGNGEQLPEATRLFMPSEIANELTRRRACAIGLAEIEARLREGEAEEALEGVRHGLRTRTMTNRYRLRHYTGQGMMTKGQGILRQVNIKIHIAKVRYRYARAALLALRGHGAWEERLKVLTDEDGGVARAAGVARGEGSHTLSWIWYTVGVQSDDESDPRLQDALRVEWSRLTEEVYHLREEMRRTIEFGYTEEEQWLALAAETLPDAAPELTEGRQAYAAEHADTERRTCNFLRQKWAGILKKADEFLEGVTRMESEELVTVELSMADELDAEEEEAALEGEEHE